MNELKFTRIYPFLIRGMEGRLYKCRIVRMIVERRSKRTIYELEYEGKIPGPWVYHEELMKHGDNRNMINYI